ncbi:MAG: DUF4861 domain-containing protein [Tannerella sp.]|jgi:hypothetical protein|nr:DUF4861 domain-containing protein [Tannerella sp.]
MKRKLFYVTPVLCLLCGTVTDIHAEEKAYAVTVSNGWDERRENEPVVLDIKGLKCGFDVVSAVVTEVYDGESSPSGGNVEVASQLDDLNGDILADELVFVADVPPRSAKTFRVVVSSGGKQKEYPPRVYAEMLVSDKNGKHVQISSLTIPGTSNIYNQLHHHGPAFESELVAYRIYFDQKQTVDIYGKFNKGFEIEESQFYPTDEQLSRGFGDDVLLVGGSCGLGTLKGWDGTKATHITPVESLRESIVAGGPVRTVVDVVSAGWQYSDAVLQMRVRYILYAGHRDCEVRVSFDRPLKQEIFSTGVLRIKESVSYSDHKGLIACWGTDWPVNDTVKYAKETVGLATSLPQELIRSEIHDRANYLYQISAEGKRGFTYHIMFTSMKETFGYKTPEAWFDFAGKWKEYLRHPCRITVKM